MFSGSNENHFILDDVFTSFQTFPIGTGSHVGTSKDLDLPKVLSYDLLNNKTEQKSALKNRSNDNFFDYLTNVSDSPLTSVSKLSEENLDLSNILQNINLDSESQNADDSGSDKENEIGKLSLADLFFKGKKEESKEFCLEPEISNDSLFQSFVKNELSVTDNLKPDNSTKIISSKSNNTANCADQDLTDLFSDLLNEQEKQDLNSLEQCTSNNFEVDLSLAQKNSDENDRNFLNFLDHGLNVQNSLSGKHTISVDEIPKAKESLFCKVLCCKLRQTDNKTAPKLPLHLSDLLSSFDYFKHFTFDTPSPDDIIKEKQKGAFQRGFNN